MASIFGKKKTSTPKVEAEKKPLEVKPNKDAQATRVKKTPIYIVAGVLAIGGFGVYESMENSSFFSDSKKPQAEVIKPAKDTYNVNPKIEKIKKKSEAAQNTKTKNQTNNTTTDNKQENNSKNSKKAKETPQEKYEKEVQALQYKQAYARYAAISTASEDSGTLMWKQPKTNKNQANTGNIANSPSSQNSVGPHYQTDPFELIPGTIIPATLEYGIKSYLPGTIQAVVSSNVYSSLNSGDLLIPAGSKIIGTYDTKTALGINRLLVAWNKIYLPNGVEYNLNHVEGAGTQGYAGFAGNVNDHTWLIFKNALLLSIVNAGVGMASPSTTTNAAGESTSNTALTTAEESLATTLGQAEA